MSGGGSCAAPPDGPSGAEWRRSYDRLEALLPRLAADRALLEALNGILHEYGDARDNINQARLHQAELSRGRWEAACKELLPVENPRLTELLECDVEDSRLCKALFEIENSELKIKLKEVGACFELSENTADHEQIARDLKADLTKLKQGYESLCAEKDFVRNQLRAMEKDMAALLKIREVEAAQATEATRKLQKNLEELQVAARNKNDEICTLRAEALAAKLKLLVAEGKPDEMHSLPREKDIQKLKDGQLESLKGKHASLPNVSEGYKTLCVNKDQAVSTELAQKDSVCNQLREMKNDNAGLFKVQEVEGAQATEATHKLQKNVEELQVPARNKDDEIRRYQAEALAVKNMLLVAKGRLDEVHPLAKEEDIQKLEDQQLETRKRKRKHASLPSESPLARQMLDLVQNFMKIEDDHGILQAERTRLLAERDKALHRAEESEKKLKALEEESKQALDQARSEAQNRERERQVEAAKREELLEGRLHVVVDALSDALGTSPDLTNSVRVDHLTDTITLIESYGSRAQKLLIQAGGAFERVHHIVLPQVTPPSSLEELVGVFCAEQDPLLSCHRERACVEAEAAFMLTIAHGVEADFDKIVSRFPKRADGKLVDLVSARNRGRQLSEKMVDMLNARTIAKAAARSARSASAGTRAASGASVQ